MIKTEFPNFYWQRSCQLQQASITLGDGTEPYSGVETDYPQGTNILYSTCLLTVTLNFYNTFPRWRWSKWTLSTSTKPSARLYKTDSPNFYKSPTCKAAVKTDIPNFYRLGDGHNGLSELFGGGKHSPNFYESPTPMAAVLSKVLKTNSSSFYKPPKRLVAVKTESSTSGLSKLLLASYTLGVGLNGLFKRERLSSPGLKRFTLS